MSWCLSWDNTAPTATFDASEVIQNVFVKSGYVRIGAF